MAGVPPAGAVTSHHIHDIQGAAHRSPLEGVNVTEVPGVVTAVRANGFWFEDPVPDADPRTSEGLFVFTSTAPTVAVGDSVLVSGTVSEFRPGGTSGTDNLSTTQVANPASP
jgi:predicted extracellular nuclease